MSQKKKSKKDPPKGSRPGIVDINKLKALGITKDPNKDDIEEITGDNITGGVNETTPTNTTIDTHWPTTGGN